MPNPDFPALSSFFQRKMTIFWEMCVSWKRRHLSLVIMPKYLNNYLAQITHFQHDMKNLVANCMQSNVLLSGQPYLTWRLFSSLLKCSQATECNHYLWGIHSSCTLLMSQDRKKKSVCLTLSTLRLILICFNFQTIQNPGLQHFKAVIKIYFLHFAVLFYLQLNLLSCFIL